MDGYLQRATVIRPKLAGKVTLKAGDRDFASVLPLAVEVDLSGRLAVIDSETADVPQGAEVLLVTAPIASLNAYRRKVLPLGVRLVLSPETPEAWRRWVQGGNGPRISTRLADVPLTPDVSFAVLSQKDVETLAALAGQTVSFGVPFDLTDRAITTNVIGYLPGRDPALGLIMLGAHLDHEGERDGRIYYGANDDASGTAAVMELARALAAGRKPRRGLLFVAFGSEELGLLGAKYFAVHSPVPLTRIAANLGLEMVGRQDAKLPRGTMMMTGYERSDLGARLSAAGGLVAPDPYPAQNFFQRSDNYALAQRGVVAHVVSGWALDPNYHTPQDTLANIDFDFMTRAIGSLVGPLRTIADSRTAPQWKPGGRPPAPE